MALSNSFDQLAGFYDLDYPDTSDHVFLRRLVAAVDPDRLLEVPCGSGRNVAPLLGAARGQVVFCDLAESMVAQAEAKIPAGDRARARGLVADLRALGASGQFDLVICPREAFQLLDRSDAAPALGSMRAALRKGGLIVVDLFQFGPETPVSADAPPDYFCHGQVGWATDWTRVTADGRLKVRRHRRQRLVTGGAHFEMRYAVWADEAMRAEDAAGSQRLELDFGMANYSAAEVARLTAASGLRVLAALSGYGASRSLARTVYLLGHESLGQERLEQSRERVHRIRAVIGQQLPAAESDRPDSR